MPTMTKIKSVAMLLAGLYVAFLAFLAFVAFSLTLKSICVALNVSFYVLLIVHFVLHVGLRSRHWIGIGSRTEMDWIGMGLPSRYVLLLMFHSMCCVLSISFCTLAVAVVLGLALGRKCIGLEWAFQVDICCS